jgi:hypothetical protein
MVALFLTTGKKRYLKMTENSIDEEVLLKVDFPNITSTYFLFVIYFFIVVVLDDITEVVKEIVDIVQSATTSSDLVSGGAPRYHLLAKAALLLSLFAEESPDDGFRDLTSRARRALRTAGAPEALACSLLACEKLLSHLSSKPVKQTDRKSIPNVSKPLVREEAAVLAALRCIAEALRAACLGDGKYNNMHDYLSR